MPMKPKNTSTGGMRPKDAFDSRMQETLKRAEREQGRQKADYDSRVMPPKTTRSTGAVTRSPRPKSRTK